MIRRVHKVFGAGVSRKRVEAFGTLMGRQLRNPLRFAVVMLVLLSFGAGLWLIVGDDSDSWENTDWIHLSSSLGEIPTPGESQEQTAALILDIDQDGLNDFVIGARKNAPALVWFKRANAGWNRYVIEPDSLPIEAGGAFHDIDRDGDLDIVMGEDASGNKMYWWENPYPVYEPNGQWNRYVIKASGANKHHDQIFGDFDADGQSEFVTWNQKAGTLLLAEIPASPKHTGAWQFHPIFNTNKEAEGLAKADVDGDGVDDLIAGGYWFKYKSGDTYEGKPIDPDMAFSRAAVGQIIDGGAPEIALVAGDSVSRLKWYELKNDVWIGHDLLGFDVSHGHSLAIEDINADGKQDIFCAEMHTPGRGKHATAWLFYGDGKGNFAKTVLSIGMGNHESKVTDLDGDGDLDILSKPYTWAAPRVDVWLNKQNRLDHWSRHVIDADRPWRSIFIAAADLDGDGARDIVTGGWWYKNPGTAERAWRRNTIGRPLNNMAVLYDFDSDGDQDIFGTKGKGSEANAELVWAVNDGRGEFRVLDNIVPGDGDFLQGIAVGRFWGNKLAVALSWHATGRGVQLLELPDNPVVEPWRIRKLSDISQDEALTAGDINLDGTTDLLLGTKWLQYNAGNTLVTSLSNDTLPDRNRLADINRDGWPDAVVGFEAINKPGELVWYQNPGVNASVWEKRLIARIVGPMSVDVGDLDGDGDYDVVAGEHHMTKGARPKLYVFENADGSGNRWLAHIVHVGDEHHDGAILTDIDDDGDLDILSIGWSHNQVLLYENRG